MNDEDRVRKARVDESLARALLTEGNAAEAERLAREAVRTLESAGEQFLLTRAATTYGTALARLNQPEQAHLILQSAVEGALAAGDYEGAGLAALTIIEELGDRLTLHELGVIYERAADCLALAQHPAILARLSAVARRVVYIITTLPLPANEQYRSCGEAWTDFSFFDEVHRYEALLIKRALREANGKVSRAAKLLGIENHQTLVFIINGRHKDLLPARRPAIPRRRNIFRDTSSSEETNQMQPITILCVEDNEIVLQSLKDTLELEEGWRVDACADGMTALSRIESDEHYDVLLIDNELPGVDGLTLIRRARDLPHRQHIPIAMLSASGIEADARRAGADEFLRKPEAITTIVEHVRRLLNIWR